MPTIEISTYNVLLYGGPDGNSGAEATVYLGLPDARAYLKFYPQDTELPPNKVSAHRSGEALYYVNYHYDQLANVIDILRNEQPVHLFFREDNLYAHLATGAEPVGEEETPA